MTYYLAVKLETLIKSERYKSLDQVPQWLQLLEPVGAQIRGLRTLLGMTQGQLARRADQQARLIRRLESGDGDPRLSTLVKAAQGLECELIIRLVPKQPVPKLLKHRAEAKAKQILALSKGTAALEEQQPEEKYIKQQLAEIESDLIDQKQSALWED